MGWRLVARDEDIAREATIHRFDPAYWTVNFPRPMMAAVTTTAPDALRVDAVFYHRDELAGLIWDAADPHDHPLLAYATDRDFRRCRLSFRWRSAGIRALDAVDGPTLTIEGRDAAGAPRAWYVRLRNYAVGDPQDAVVTIDFGSAAGGFLLPGEADPLWAGDIDRMFVSLVAPGYDRTPAPLPVPAEGWVELSGIACTGSGAVLAVGDALLPEHRLSIATGYDDLYHLTPERVLRNILHLGYRGSIVHYVGMSHYFRLDGAGLATAAGGALNGPCAAWHRDLLARAKPLGFRPILSLSYELLDRHCPAAWKQRAHDGAAGLTGWDPPSALLSPAQAAAMAYLQGVGRAFAALARAAGLPVRFQIGEPWWWVRPADGAICLYDAAAQAALGPAMPALTDVRGSQDAAARDLLDRAGAVLAASTAALRDAVRGDGAAEVLLLVYLPTVLDAAAPEVLRANVPIGWARPAYDILQLEDYDWVTAGNGGATMRGVAAATARLGYAPDTTHYFSGFVLRPEDRGQWAAIDAAADAAVARGTAETFVWALPQVLRDGYLHFDMGEEAAVEAFDDVSFPLAIGARASVEPGFSTQVVTSAAGYEQRNADWAAARLRFDAGPGVRSEADVATLIAFFRARMGQARGFRFRDPFDDSSAGMTAPPGPADQRIGTGDGVATRFPLAKAYGATRRRITRPAPGSVQVSVAGQERLTGWALAGGGIVAFDAAPAAGAAIEAGFRFDVPVRFATDRLEVMRTTHGAAETPAVPLIEVREG